MDEKQKKIVNQYYKSTQSKTAYCRECGCALDMVAAQETFKNQASNKLKTIIVFLFIAFIIACSGLVVSANMISDLKTSAKNDKSIINELNSKLFDAKQEINFYDTHIGIVIDGRTIYHKYSCNFIQNTKKSYTVYDIKKLKSMGYRPCKVCH